MPDALILSAVRTPIGRARKGSLTSVDAYQLAEVAVSAAVDRSQIPIADLDRQIHGEAERIVRSLENDARMSGTRVESLTAALEQLKRQAASSNGQDVELRALEREAKAQRDLLESYLAKYREATARDNLGALPADANTTIIYATGISTGAKQPDAAKALAKFLATAPAAPVIRKDGMDPA